MAIPAPWSVNHPGRPRYKATIPSRTADSIQKRNELRRPCALRTDPVREAPTPAHSMTFTKTLLLTIDMDRLLVRVYAYSSIVPNLLHDRNILILRCYIAKTFFESIRLSPKHGEYSLRAEDIPHFAKFHRREAILFKYNFALGRFIEFSSAQNVFRFTVDRCQPLQ